MAITTNTPTTGNPAMDHLLSEYADGCIRAAGKILMDRGLAVSDVATEIVQTGREIIMDGWSTTSDELKEGLEVRLPSGWLRKILETGCWIAGKQIADRILADRGNSEVQNV